MTRTAALVAMLLASAACFDPPISRRPTDAERLPPPTYEWSPERGEVWEMPLPTPARWLPEEQERERERIAAAAPEGSVVAVAVYATDLSLAEVSRFYASIWKRDGEATGQGRVRFPERGLFPEVTLEAGPPTRILLVKILPAGTVVPGGWEPESAGEARPLPDSSLRSE